MTVARVRQLVTAVPFPFLDKIEEMKYKLTSSEIWKWLSLLTLTREEKIAKVIKEADEIASTGEIPYHFQQRSCFVRLWVYTRKYEQYKLDFGHRSHFTGAYRGFPHFQQHGRVKLTARKTRLPFSNPMKASSYLEIEALR